MNVPENHVPNPDSGMSGVKKEHIDARIAKVWYRREEGTTITMCYIQMVNGFIAIGHSACVDPYGFDQVMGEKIAYANTYEQLWALEGYLLAERRAAIKGA